MRFSNLKYKTEIYQIKYLDRKFNTDTRNAKAFPSKFNLIDSKNKLGSTTILRKKN